MDLKNNTLRKVKGDLARLEVIKVVFVITAFVYLAWQVVWSFMDYKEEEPQNAAIILLSV